MSDEARATIQRAYLEGESIEEISRLAGVSIFDAETYLRWWCDRGCPGAQVTHR